MFENHSNCLILKIVKSELGLFSKMWIFIESIKNYWYNLEYFWRENSNIWNICNINRRKWDILAIFKHCREGREMGELTIFILSNFDAISQCFVINAFGFIFQAFFFFDDKIDLADSFMNK